MRAGVHKRGFRVREWRVQPALSQLEQDGRVVQLEPKVMALLELLASRPGDVFSRQELEEAIWQGTVVGYDALAKAVNKLREALGDNKNDPQYIQTISKKGYRLIAEVRVETSDQASVVESGVAQATRLGEKKPGVFRHWLAIGSVLTAVAIIGLSVFLLTKEKQHLPVRHTASVAEAKPTVVILPFRNISPGDKDDYLADGLTSDLTTSLSKLSGLWVTASNATLIYKNKTVTPEEIRQEFNARYVISGDVNKLGQAIRINVHLSDLESSKILWSERYDRQYTDLFAIQDEVTQQILHSLSLTLTNEEKRHIAKRYTNNLEAYETFLRAQYLLNARTPEDNATARDLYKKAIGLDPGFARAYAGMSYSYAVGYLRQWPADTDQPLEKALQLANQALALDKELPESYWAAAFIYFYKLDLDKGTQLLEQALKLNPNYADAYAMLAANAISQGEPERALEIMPIAYRLNPAGGYLYDMQMGRANYFLNNYDLAYNYFTSALARNPAVIDSQMYMAAICIRLGRYDEAGWMIHEARQTNPDFDPHAWAMAYPYLDNMGYREKLLKDIGLAEAYSRKKK